MLLVASCDSADRRLAYKTERLLNDADVFLDRMDAVEALDCAKDAKHNLEELLADDPNNPDYILLMARANLTLFLAENMTVFEEAPMDPLNLIRLPAPEKYLDYGNYIVPTVESLKVLLRLEDKLSLEQQASAHTILASALRLAKDSLTAAITQYQLAVKANEKLLEDLRAQKNSKEAAIQRIKNQIRVLQNAQGEVYLLAYEWDKALDIFETIMGGKNLSYFSYQFEAYQKELEEIEKKIASQEKKRENGSRGYRFLTALRKVRGDKLDPLEELAKLSPWEAAKFQTLLNLTATQNNLVYRIICFYQLKKKDDLENARKILQQYYPDIERELMEALTPTTPYSAP